MKGIAVAVLAASLLMWGLEGVVLAESEAAGTVPKGCVGFIGPQKGYLAEYNHMQDTTLSGWHRLGAQQASAPADTATSPYYAVGNYNRPLDTSKAGWQHSKAAQASAPADIATSPYYAVGNYNRPLDTGKAGWQQSKAVQASAPPATAISCAMGTSKAG